MDTPQYTIAVSYEQILCLVKQLSLEDRAKLGHELVKETIDHRLSRLLNVFYTTELSQDDIDSEIEAIRTELYDKKQVDLEASSETMKKENTDFQNFLLQGPVMTNAQYEVCKENRKDLNQWRKK
jgi:hypothetical protein